MRKVTPFRRTNIPPGCREYARVGADASSARGEAERDCRQLTK